MAFTVKFDDATELLLKEIKERVKAKSKTDALKYLIYTHDQYIDQIKIIAQLQAKIEVLMNHDFAMRLGTLIRDDIEKQVIKQIDDDRYTTKF
jgi:hypothetical protein